MALAVEAPAREDLSFRTNDDKLVGARWLMSDGVTPVAIVAAVMTLRFDPPSSPVVNPLVFIAPDEHRIDSTTPGDPEGWISEAYLTDGTVLVNVPHGIWADHETRTGTWDLIATGEIQRCLVRGCFVAEEGIST